ncbi:MAG: tetratricopeptide repeat protein [Promethearchaeota archaeon]
MTSTDEWFNIGVSSYQKKDFKKALEAFQKVIQSDPNRPLPWQYLGQIYFKLNNFNIAIKYFEEAAKLDPMNYKARYDMGLAYASLGNFEKEIECYKMAVEISPDFGSAWLNMGISNSNLGLKTEKEEYFKESIKCFKKLIRIDERHIRGWLSLGVSYMDLKDFTNAINCFKKVIELEPQDTGGWNNMGVSYEKLGNLDKALDCYEKVLNINPRHSDAWCNIGLVNAKQKKDREALKFFEKSIMFNLKNLSAWSNMSESYSNLGDYDKAIECAESGLKFAPNHPVFLDLLHKFREEKEIKGTKKLKDPTFFSYLCTNCQHMEPNVPLDTQYCAKCGSERLTIIGVRKEKTEWIEWFNKGLSFFELGKSNMYQTAMAYECFKKVIEINPQNKEAQNYLKEIREKRNPSEALRALAAKALEKIKDKNDEN